MSKKGNNLLHNIPNIISAFRILLVGVFAVYFVREKYTLSLVAYAAAFLSDVLDGQLARKYNWITSIGKLLDPLADKLMLVTALVCFTAADWIPIWVIVAVASKECFMCVCGFLLYRQGVVVEANILGKIATGLWTGGVVLTLTKQFISQFSSAAQIVSITANVVLIAAMAVSFSALVNYTVRYLAIAQKNKNTP